MILSVDSGLEARKSRDEVKRVYKIYRVTDRQRDAMPDQSAPEGEAVLTLLKELPDLDQALAFIRPLQPDLLLTDRQIPFPDCREFSRIAKTNLPGLKIILIQGSAAEESFRSADKAHPGPGGPDAGETAIRENKAEQNLELLLDNSRHFMKELWFGRQGAENGRPDRGDGPGVLDQAILRLNEMAILEALRYGDKAFFQKTVLDCVAGLRERRMGVFLHIYLFIGIILAMVKFVAELGGNVAEVLPDLDELEVVLNGPADQRKPFVYLERLLDRTLQFRESKRLRKYYEVIHKAKEFIQQHYADPNLSLNTVASFVNMSPSHFCTVFGKETGETLIQYLTNIRIKKAMELLKTTHLSTAEIAARIGYNDSNYFCHIFKKTTGVNARDFRNGP